MTGAGGTVGQWRLPAICSAEDTDMDDIADMRVVFRQSWSGEKGSR